MTVAEETVTLELLAKLVQKSIDEGRQHRKDMLELKQLHVAQYETIKRTDRRIDGLERRISDLRDELELTIKMELGGALANMQTTIENSLGRIEDKVDELARRIDVLERKSHIH